MGLTFILKDDYQKVVDIDGEKIDDFDNIWKDLKKKYKGVNF